MYNKMYGNKNIGVSTVDFGTIDNLGVLGSDDTNITTNIDCNNGGLLGVIDNLTEERKIEIVTYLTVIEKAPNFIGLDISVNSTGWIKWHDGKLSYGTYGLINTSELERRQEFKRFLKDLVGDDEYEFVGVEDTIGSCNYEVLKFLVQLNSIVDDMIYDKILNIKEVKRVDNKVWKRIMHEVSGTTLSITKCKDKQLIKECMNDLGLTKEILGDHVKFKGLRVMTDEDKVTQDVYDVIGMSVALIVRDYLKIPTKKNIKLKNDIRKGYKFEQFIDIFGARERAKTISTKKGREVCELDFTNITRDLVFNFKKAVAQHGDEKLFIITIPTSKLGVLVIEKDLNTDNDICYLLVYRNIRGVGKNVQ